MYLHLIASIQLGHQGVEKHYVTYILIAGGLVVGYFLLRAMVKWFIGNGLFDFLSYLMVSGVLLILLFSNYFLLGLSIEYFHVLLRALLQGLAGLGGCLVLWNGIKMVFKKHN
ncbi:hypothetical protein [Oceanobacillus kapialis]|uniref:hypothetical protein n=1 Tax=Oceanobacillus kapialis TaxID=481353 RepID=UPI00384DF5BD